MINTKYVSEAKSKSELIAAQRPYVLRVCQYFLPDPQDAEDLTQDVLIKAILKQDLFDGRFIRAWLAMIVKNEFVNQKRSRECRPVVDPDSSEALTSGHGIYGSVENDAATNIDAKDNHSEIFARLSELQSYVLCLHAMGYTYRETAALIDRPLGTVRSILHRARELMKQDVKQPKKYEK